VSKTLRDRIPGFYSINVHAIDPVKSSPRVQPSAAFFSIGGGLFAIVPSISQLWLPAMPSPSAVEKYLAYKKKPKEELHATSLLMLPTIECFIRIRNFKMLLRSGCETRILRGGPGIEKSVHGIAAALRTAANQKEPWSARHLETFLHGLSGTNQNC
jgi:hypothetical protein